MLPVDKKRAYTYGLAYDPAGPHFRVCLVCTVCNIGQMGQMGQMTRELFGILRTGIGPAIVHRCPRLLASLELLLQNDETHRQFVIT